MNLPSSTAKRKPTGAHPLSQYRSLILEDCQVQSTTGTDRKMLHIHINLKHFLCFSPRVPKVNLPVAAGHRARLDI